MADLPIPSPGTDTPAAPSLFTAPWLSRLLLLLLVGFGEEEAGRVGTLEDELLVLVLAGSRGGRPGAAEGLEGGGALGWVRAVS